MADAAEPVQFVDTGNSHDYGEPGARAAADALRRLRGAAARRGGPHGWPEAELHGHTWRLYIGPVTGRQGSPVGVLGRARRAQTLEKADVTLRVINHAGRADNHAPRRHLGENDPPRSAPAWGVYNSSAAPTSSTRPRAAQRRRPHRRGGHPRVQQDAAAVVPSVARPQRLPPPIRERRELGRHLHRRRGARARAPPILVARARPRACAPTPTTTLRSRRSRPPCSRRSCASPTATSSPRQTCSTADGARGVLKAADRFGVTRLKQLAEIELATRHLSVESAADLLLLADAHSCPQLKESATELFVSKAPEVMATAGWARLGASATCSESWWCGPPPTSPRETTTARARRTA